MLAVINHPDLVYDWFTTVLLSWSGVGPVIYQRWALTGAGIVEATPEINQHATVLLDAYYLMYLFAFVNTLWLMRRWRKDGWLKIERHVGYDSVIFAIIGTLIGAHFVYIFVYNPDFYFKDAKDIGETLQRIFLNWSGMASHGAAAGIVIAMGLYRLIAGAPWMHIGDLGCTAGAAGAMFIRTGNFLNGELYGRQAPEWLPWAMRFEVKSGQGHQLAYKAGEWFQVLHQTGKPDEFVPTKPYQLGYELMARASDGTRHFFAADSVPAQFKDYYLTVITSPRHPSQLYQLVLEGLILFLVMLFLRKRVKRVGMLAGVFFTGYPLARFIGEFFRQPDVQFATEGNPLGTVAGWLSMGQVLSLVMAGFGVAMLVYFSKKGKLISELEMWPPKKGTKPVSYPSVSGETSAGDLSGITYDPDGNPISRIQQKLKELGIEERKDDHA